MMNPLQRKGDVKSSEATAIIHHGGGTTLLGDATLLPRALMCKQGLESNLRGGLMLTRAATPSVLCAIATEFTGKKYSPRSKADKEKAVKDLDVWIKTMQASIPHIDETAEIKKIAVKPEIRREASASWRNAVEAGSCNGCNDPDVKVVAEVNLMNMRFRVCPACRSNLIGLFSQMGQPRI